MVDFIDEVTEDLRHERLARLWKRVGRYVIGGAVVVVLATAATVAWQSYWTSRQQEATEKLYFALKSGNAEALQAFDGVSADAVPALARLRSALLAVKDKDMAKASALYAAVYEDGSADSGLRDLARVYAVQSLAAQGADAAAIEKMVKPVADDKASPFRPLALEQLALVALERGDKAKANEWLALLAGAENAPQSITRRAQLMANLVKRQDESR